MQREIAQHFVGVENSCHCFYGHLFACNCYAAISLKYCEIRMKINADPSGREVISLLKADSLLVLVNGRKAKKVSAK
jgi:hypothetical protein